MPSILSSLLLNSVTNIAELNVSISIDIDGKKEIIGTWTLLLAFLIPVAALAIIVCIGIATWRRRTFAYDYSYQQVNHDLDDEEIEFKRLMESKQAFNKVDSVIDETDEELSFSTSDLGRLDMLEKFRDKLVAGVQSEMEEAEDARL